MKTIIISSKLPFLIENEKSYYIDENLSLQIENFENNTFFKIYPINQGRNSIPYCISLYFDKNKLSCDSEFVKIYEFANRYEVFVNAFKIPSSNIMYSQSHTIKNTKYLITCYDDRVKIWSNKGEYVFEENFVDVSSCVEGENINILTKNKDNKILICFDTKNNTFSKISGEKIEIKNNKITSQTNLHDMASHIKICSYDMSAKLQEENLYMKKPEPKYCKNKNLMPYNFFEAVKCKDFSQARFFLTQKLNNLLTDNAISEFFGNFEDIKITNLSPLTYTLYSSDKAKDYEIILKNDKIDDIV